MTDPRRRIPRTDTALADPRFAAGRRELGDAAVRAALSAAQEQARDGRIEPEQVLDTALRILPGGGTTLRSVLNATGVVVHTNLGRAALSPAARAALAVAAGAVDLEFDLRTGRRSARAPGVRAALLRAVPGAQDALVVNNGAAALLLAVTALAADGEVVVSRGELVEIGDGFRLPDLMESTGARIREVGTTNRTTRADFAAAVGPRTGCVVKVHPSNFAMTGFVSSVPVSELAGLGVPVVVDIGSGLLAREPLLPDEPDAAGTLAAGADLVTCSGDKLLGGPQAGLILGRAELVQRLRRHPLARALRPDKLTLAALEATVADRETPTAVALHAHPADLRIRCERLAALLPADLQAQVIASAGVVGGGGAPGVQLPGWAVSLPAVLALPLRLGDPAVIGRVADDRLLLDPRCVPADRDAELAAAVARAAAR